MPTYRPKPSSLLLEGAMHEPEFLAWLSSRMDLRDTASVVGARSLPTRGPEGDHLRFLDHQRIYLREFEIGGRGLAAATLIRKGDRLLRLPESVLLTPEVAARGERGREEAGEEVGIPAT